MGLSRKTKTEEVSPREKIIEAATVLFALEGLHGVSTRDIARESGLNSSLISYYFGGKEGLYQAVIQEFMLKVFGQIELALQQFENEKINQRIIQKTIETFISTLVSLRIENKHMAKIMIRERLSGMPFSREIHEEIINKAGNRLSSIIVSGQEAGVVRAELNPHFFVFCLVESVMGLFNAMDCHLSLNKKLYKMPEQKDAFIEQFVLIFLKGMLV